MGDPSTVDGIRWNGGSRVDRHIVNGLAESAGESQIQPLFEPPARGNEQTVIVRIAAGVLEKDLAELWIGPEVIGRETSARIRRVTSTTWHRSVGDRVRASQPVGKISEIQNIYLIRFHYVRPSTKKTARRKP